MKNLSYLLFVVLSIFIFQSCGDQIEYGKAITTNDVTTTLGDLNSGCESYGSGIPLLSEVGVKDLHDYFSYRVCEYIQCWLNEEMTSSEVQQAVFDDLLVSETAIALNFSESKVLSLYDSLGINSSNYIDFGLDKDGDLGNYQALYDSIDVAWRNTSTIPDFLLELDTIEANSVFNNLDSDLKTAIVDVARSSFPYWYENHECVFGTTKLSTKQKAGILAFADVWGAATGGLMGFFTGAGVGSVPGAMIGAEAGTLGASIGMAIFS